ncbi:PLP-dependent aminotransferase family protein [Vibrio genomosp. F10]|uniref:GntR family transcriptional regulator n=1 Tax=Vibrio genomosp. F10 TaxID=723171 RepID=A0A1B9R0V2_9VIBR|nr:PLP-dependent aminotransferase family protein [Vibrio genomosp. F10]OCH77684.1 GntR family transcriptional regulator [Vibrio genomosp. F10]
MQPIDVGDLAFDRHSSSLQKQLFSAIRSKISGHLWAKGGKLPSTRKLSLELSISRNTVIAVYEQLVAEGYLESRAGSGFYVAIELPDYTFSDYTFPDHAFPEHVSSTSKNVATQKSEVSSQELNRSFAPGVPDLAQFPLIKWNRLLQRHATRVSLLGSQDIQGDRRLREALCDYLSSSRSVSCSADQIVITAGAQQALTIALMATLKPNDQVLMENPGYVQMRKSIDLLGLQLEPVEVVPKAGIDLDHIKASTAKCLYVTPSNQYPMGTSVHLEQRIELVRWAREKSGWIIEDDYDSEFQFAHRPYPSLQGLSAEVGAKERIFYIGSLSKVMFNGLRLGYLIVPQALLSRSLEIKDALSGDSPSHVQAALADFILEGDLLRHIRKMRRLYKHKYELMMEAIGTHFLGRVEVISQAAGLHITFRWKEGCSELELCQRAKEKGITIRPLSMYEYQPQTKRDWQAVVLGFGNIELDDIDPKIATLAQLL